MTQIFRPFVDDAGVVTIGGLTVENGTRAVAMHGTLDLGRDRRSLARARALKAILDAVVAHLEAASETAALPEAAAETAAATTPKANPFA